MWLIEVTGALLLPGEGWRGQKFLVMERTLEDVFQELLLTDAFKALKLQKRPPAGVILTGGSLLLRFGCSGYSELQEYRRTMALRNPWIGERSGSAPYVDLFDMINQEPAQVDTNQQGE